MNKHLVHSIALHIAVVILFLIDMPELWHHDMTLGQAPIIVDLSEVRIDEFTNLPAKAEFGPEDRKATVAEKPKEQYTEETPPEPEPEPVKEEPKAQEPEPQPTPEPEPADEPKQDYVAPPEPTKKPEQKKPEPKPTPKKPPVPSAKPKPKPQPKPEPKKPETPKKPQEQPKVQNNALKDLMREIDNNKNIDLGEKTQSAMIKEGTEVKHMGIEGGNSNGSYLSDLTISETDAIASLLRQNWNLDPGAIGMENMMVPIRVYLARDGSIQKIEFIEQGRFNSDPSYRSVAESAQRAIYATQGAFKEVFGVKYSDRYDVWKTLLLKFDPLDKGIK